MPLVVTHAMPWSADATPLCYVAYYEHERLARLAGAAAADDGAYQEEQPNQGRGYH